MSKEKKTSDIMIRKIPAELKKNFHLWCLLNDITMRQAFLDFMDHCTTGQSYMSKTRKTK